MNAYLAWKWLHILSASVLFGTGTGIAFFAWFGYRRALRLGEIEGLRSVLSLTVIADTVFTAPAVVVQLASGLALLHINRWPLTSLWVQVTLGLYLLVGALWLPVIALQIQMSRAAQRAPSIAALGAGFHRRYVLWFMLGVPAFLIVMAIFWLMVAKPLPLV